jgi:hypothetical protein
MNARQSDLTSAELEQARWVARFLLELIDAWAGLWPDIRFEDRKGRTADSIVDIAQARFLDALATVEVRLTFAVPTRPLRGSAPNHHLSVWRHNAEPDKGSVGESIAIGPNPSVGFVLDSSIRLLGRAGGPRVNPVPMLARLRNVAAAERDLVELREPRQRSATRLERAGLEGDAAREATGPGARGSDSGRRERERRAEMRRTRFLLIGSDRLAAEPAD